MLRERTKPLDQLYICRNPEAVQKYLDEYPFLVPLLHEAHEKIMQYFPLARIFLQVVHDQEDTHSSELVAFIGTQCSAGEAFDRLQRLDAEWWLVQRSRISGDRRCAVRACFIPSIS